MLGVPAGRKDHTAVWTGTKMIVWGGWNIDSGTSAPVNSGGIYDPATDTWAATSLTNAPAARFYHTAVSTGSKMIVWGGGYSTGGVYDPATDTWAATSLTNAPAARDFHTVVWTGSKMIVWGGLGGTPAGVLNTGGIYDPARNSWAATSTAGAPTARCNHTAVWTGSRMVIWTGIDSTGYVNSGGTYDPATDTWTPMSLTNAPAARIYTTAVWTGTKMIVWGGYDGALESNTGGIYDPATDTWVATSTTGAPAARQLHTAVWTGARMIVWGGVGGGGYPDSGGIYDPTTDTWTATSLANAPTARHSHTAVWTGSKMIVWGGFGPNYNDFLNTGGVYSNPAVLPPPPPPADFYTVTPCRLADTRKADGPLGGPALVAGAVRSFPVAGVCGVPFGATAVSFNVTAVGPAAQGHLTVYSGDAASPPPTSTLNFPPRATRAGNGVVGLARNGGTINVKNGSAGAVDLVLDVKGYYQ
jgi:N-acetylneuraminic acid mutarotase